MDREPRPYVTIELFTAGGDWQALSYALVDSGADGSALDIGIAETLGVSRKSLTKHKAKVPGGSIACYRSDPPLHVRARVRPLVNEFALTPVFIEPKRQLKKFRFWRAPQMTLLGESDFLKAWEVSFNARTQRMTLTWLGEAADG